MKYILTVDTNYGREVVCEIAEEGKPYVQESNAKLQHTKEEIEKRFPWRIYRIYQLKEVSNENQPG